MANIDNPKGFIPYKSKTGTISSRTYLSDGSAAIFKGDPVKKDGSGRVLSITATGDSPMGVAAHHVAATAGLEVKVYDDLVNTTFITQSDDATLTDNTSNGNFFDITVTTGDTTTLRSKMELDGNGSAEDVLILIDKINRVDNTWAANVDVEVAFRVDTQAVVIIAT